MVDALVGLLRERGFRIFCLADESGCGIVVPRMGLCDKVGIVVPVLDDASVLRRLLLWRKTNCPEVPVWVVDGGSDDGLVTISRAFDVVVVESEAGRAVQMNAGASAAVAAGCDILWFLHADALPPNDAIARIQAAVKSDAVGGGFNRRFEHPSVWLKFTCWLADWRCRSRGWFLGDQGIFVGREVFEALGGFPEWPWFEDFEFSKRLARHGRTVLIDSILMTSGRRFERLGAWTQTWRDFFAMRWYLHHGVPPEKMDSTNPGAGEIFERTKRPSSR